MSICAANEAITKADIPLELVRGEGYHYFIYDDVPKNNFETTSIYVLYTNTYTSDEWVEVAQNIWEDIKSNLKDNR